MVGIEESLVYHACADPAIAAIIGDRFFPVMVPSDEQRPCAVYHVMHFDRMRTFAGAGEMGMPIIDIKLWATDYPTVKALERAFVARFDGETADWGPRDSKVHVQNCEVQGRHDVYERPVHSDEVGNYSVQFELHIWYEER